MFERESDDVIPITFGDVVNTGDMEEFGILSGDDLMLRLS
jgi:isopentenyl phosphate kinase